MVERPRPSWLDALGGLRVRRNERPHERTRHAERHFAYHAEAPDTRRVRDGRGSLRSPRLANSSIRLMTASSSSRRRQRVYEMAG
jgi:hypothetical protein